MSLMSDLWALHEARGDITRITAQIEALRGIATRTGQITEGERVQTSGSGDKLSAIAAKIVDAEREREKSEDEFVAIFTAVQRVIYSLPDEDEQLVLTFRVIGDMPASRSAQELCAQTGRIISERQERRIYSRARSHVNDLGDSAQGQALTRTVEAFRREKDVRRCPQMSANDRGIL